MIKALQQEVTEALLHCNKCGLCLAGCPIYKVTGIEWTAARGRLALLRSFIDDELELSELREPLYNCLTCNCCVDHCPSGVLTDELILRARTEFMRNQGQPWIQKLIFRKILPNPSHTHKLVSLFGWIQASGLRLAARKLGLITLLGNPGKAEPILPAIPLRHHIASTYLSNLEHPKYRVAYFIGCAGNYFSPEVSEAAIRVLNKHKVEVVIPNFVCCGMPAYCYGDV